jgi:copper transport protein
MVRAKLAAIGVSLGLVVVALAPSAAFGHAVLRGTDPVSGATAKREPNQIVFHFSESVEGNFGAIRVYDRNGKRAEQGDAFHPGGKGSELATHLANGLPKGTYTATYRVISADGHPVSGGLVFSIGAPSATAGKTVSQLLAERSSVGTVTEVGFAVVRGLQYVSIAIAIGAIFFLFAIWIPGLASVAGGDRRWQLASERFVARLRTLIVIAIVTGVLSGALGIVFQGATAAGVSFWSALKSETVKEVLGTRWGTVWSIRVLVWLSLGAVLTAAFARGRQPVLRPASVGATGLALTRSISPLAFALLALPLGFLALSPALAGHASLQSPTGVLMPANVIHVIAISVWSAGVAILILALKRATQELEPPDRARLLAANLIRFSAVAGVAFALLVVTGLVQSYVEVRSIDNALHTEFGRLALIKFGIVIGPLLLLGAYNRRLNVPHLRDIARTGGSPGRSGRLLRRALRAEIALLLVVFGVTAVLVSKPPSIALTNAGPVSKTASLGPADLQLTVDPARVGSNAMHIYLIDKKTGAQYDKVKELQVKLSQPGKGVGPLDAGARKAGPGHYVMTGAVFGVSGDWNVQVSARVSEFDAYYSTMKVKIR